MILVMWSDLMMRPRPNSYFLVIAFALIGIFLFPFQARSTDDKARQSADPKMQLIYSLKGAGSFSVSTVLRAMAAKAKAMGHRRALNSKVPDLTTIENDEAVFFQKNGYEATDCREQSVLARGAREMPIWGPIFHQD